MLRLMYITNNEEVAQTAEAAGVDWIFVDLEIKGKQDRQKGRNTVISAHTIEDVKRIRRVLQKSKLMVRVNPLGEWSKKEIDEVVEAGADIVMLPYFKTSEEVKQFITLVNERIVTCLLVETLEAVNNIDEILSLGGIDFVHIGLNDIHIQRKTHFMFEYLADGHIDMLAKKIRKKDIPFGFGGVAYIGSDLLPPAENIIAEHYRLGSTGIILSRSFMDSSNIDNFDLFQREFINRVDAIRKIEKKIESKDRAFFEKNKKSVKEDTCKIRDTIKKGDYT